MKYEVGDKVLIKDINWYNENKDEDGDISCGEFNFVSQMSKFCGKILTIDVDFEDGTYLMKEDTDGFVFTNEMFDVFAEEEAARLVDNFSSRWVNEFELPDGYIFKDENGNIINAQKIVLEKKKKEYPKTYEECCKMMGINHTNDLDICEHCDYKTEITFYEDSLLEKIESLYRLIICRDSYWKIAGEEMGLDGPWKPDWKGEGWYVIVNHRGDIVTDVQWHANAILAFPTEEMRDAFYENFKELIEQCKELL